MARSIRPAVALASRGTKSAEPPASAGDAFSDAMKGSPQTEAAWCRASAKFKLFVQLYAAVGKVEADRWQQEYGEPYPASLEDWERLAMRAGASLDYLKTQRWTPAQLAHCIEGYLQGQRERRQGADDVWDCAKSKHDWQSQFDMSATTFRRYVKAGLIRVKEVTSQKVHVHKEDVATYSVRK